MRVEDSVHCEGLSVNTKDAIGVTSIPRAASCGSEKGFSIVELMVVTIIIFIVTSMAVIQLEPAWQQIQANAALDEMKSTLRQARELAISERRTIAVAFPAAAPNTSCLPSVNVSFCITLTQMTVTAAVPPAPPTQALAANPFLIIPLENNVRFMSFTGEPDTPDAFIGAAPVPANGLYYGSTAGVPPTGLQFQSDGTFTNGNVNPINLTIFMGETNLPTTARAITILGNTGKVTAYQGTGKAWFK
jgi:Tfp pilus assembly protein FimT